MAKVWVNIPPAPAISYPILMHGELLQQAHIWLSKKNKFEKIVVITDHIVKKLYGRDLVHSLRQQGWQVILLAFRAGESSKNQQTKQYLENKMLQRGCNRNTLCLALGGGVVGDVAGFVAATYLRGIPMMQIPTSLLAMVDSSVGGKTAIDTVYGKNLIGTFWQPMAVIADIHCLKSLPKKQLINGLIEAIKMALTSDHKGYEFIQKRLRNCLAGDEKTLQNVIQRAVKIKAAIVSQDEREKNGLRLVLNFGHTIGHALEKVTGYKILHGYAVGYGILVEAKIAELLGILSSADFLAITALFSNLGIYAQDLKKYSIKALINAAKLDKKIKSGKTHYVLLKKIGQVCIEPETYTYPVADNIVQRAFQQIVGTSHGRQ